MTFYIGYHNAKDGEKPTKQDEVILEVDMAIDYVRVGTCDANSCGATRRIIMVQ